MTLSFAMDVQETLRAVEWSGEDISAKGWRIKACPFCNSYESSGLHTDDCRVALLIARATDEIKRTA
jgi:hypothetical protein